MSKSFIEFKNKGFWIPDAVISLVARYLEYIITTDKMVPEWIAEMQNHLHHLSLEHYPGWASLPLNNNLTDEDKKKEFILVLEKTIDFLKTKGDVISIVELNANRDDNFSTTWQKDINTINLIHVIKRLINLINENDGYNYREDFILSIINPEAPDRPEPPSSR